LILKNINFRKEVAKHLSGRTEENYGNKENYRKPEKKCSTKSKEMFCCEISLISVVDYVENLPALLSEDNSLLTKCTKLIKISNICFFLKIKNRQM